MLLIADIGNTNITLGVFDNDQYVNEIRLATDKDLRERLVIEGEKQLLKFDSSKQRADKIIALCETVVTKRL